MERTNPTKAETTEYKLIQWKGLLSIVDKFQKLKEKTEFKSVRNECSIVINALLKEGKRLERAIDKLKETV